MRWMGNDLREGRIYHEKNASYSQAFIVVTLKVTIRDFQYYISFNG